MTQRLMRSHHTIYLSMKSQNEFIELMSSETRKKIVEEVWSFLVMAYTITEVSLKN